MKNLMPKVAEMLGVEIGEEFTIKNSRDKQIIGDYQLKNDGLYTSGGLTAAGTLTSLLSGQKEIIHKPFMPKEGDKYWVICTKGEIYSTSWDGGNIDLARLNLGNCFPSEQAAKKAKPEMLAKFEAIKRGEKV